MSLLEKLFNAYGTPKALGWGRFSDEKFVPDGRKFCYMESYLQCNGPKVQNIYHVGKIVGLWHCGACAVIACKEFCTPDGCRPDGEHWRYYFGCFQEIMAKLEQAQHVRD